MLSSVKEEWIEAKCAEALQRFIDNSIWNNNNIQKDSIYNKLILRLIEMKNRYSDLHSQTNIFPEEEANSKTKMLKVFSSEQLENILYKSSRNSKCNTIDDLFITLNPIQGVLTCLHKQFGKIIIPNLNLKKNTSILPGIGKKLDTSSMRTLSSRSSFCFDKNKTTVRAGVGRKNSFGDQKNTNARNSVRLSLQKSVAFQKEKKVFGKYLPVNNKITGI